MTTTVSVPDELEFNASLESRFWSRIDIAGPDDCWEWTGGRNSRGYGKLGANGSHVSAHRIAWHLTFGGIPEGVYVLHHCDNRACVNPSHLFLGDQKDNMKDMYMKGRAHHASGKSHPRARLTEAGVREIRRRYAEGNTTQRQLADEYGVSKSAIAHVVHRRAWEHVE